MPIALARPLAVSEPDEVRAFAAPLVRLARTALLVHAALLPISIAGMQISLAVVLGALVLARAGGVRSWVRGPLDAPVLFLTAAGAASVAVAWALGGIAPASLFHGTLWKAFPAPLVLAAACEARLPGEAPAARERALAAVTVWAISCVVVGAVSIAQPWTGFDPLHAIGLRALPLRSPADLADWPGHWRAVGFFGGYVILPLLLVPPLGLVAGLALLAPLPRWRRALLGVAAVAGLAAAVLAQTRAVWGALAAIAGTLLLVGRRRALPVAVAAGVAAALALAAPGVRLRLERGVNADMNADRVLIWRVCGDVLRDHPVTGVGLGNFGAVSQPYFDRIAPEFVVRTACHDATLTFLVEGGPLLLAAGVAYWLLLARAFLRARRQRDAFGRAAAGAALAALAGAFANTLFHDPFHVSHSAYAMGFAFGAAWVLARPRDGTGAPDLARG